VFHKEMELLVEYDGGMPQHSVVFCFT